MFPPPPGLRTLLLHPGRRAHRRGVKTENENETKNETTESHKPEHEGQKDEHAGQKDDAQDEEAAF